MVKCASGSLCQSILGSLCKCNCNWLPKLLVKARKRKVAEERERWRRRDRGRGRGRGREKAGKLAGSALVWFLLCCLSSLVLACFLWYSPHAPNERLNDWSTDPVMQIVASSPVKLLLIAPAIRPSVSMSPVSLGRLWRRQWRQREMEREVRCVWSAQAEVSGGATCWAGGFLGQLSSWLILTLREMGRGIENFLWRLTNLVNIQFYKKY